MRIHPSLLGDHSECDPPDPISNSEVKLFSADGSVGSPHVRVGHRQALIFNPVAFASCGVFFGLMEVIDERQRFRWNCYLAGFLFLSIDRS